MKLVAAVRLIQIMYKYLSNLFTEILKKMMEKVCGANQF